MENNEDVLGASQQLPGRDVNAIENNITSLLSLLECACGTVALAFELLSDTHFRSLSEEARKWLDEHTTNEDVELLTISAMIEVMESMPRTLLQATIKGDWLYNHDTAEKTPHHDYIEKLQETKNKALIYWPLSYTATIRSLQLMETSGVSSRK